jgi:putative peptide zinc metalloprotease protein
MIHVVLHEAAHALTCKHFGRAVRRAGVGWYYFVPVAFVDTSDIWPAPQWQRVLVSAAGPYSNLVLAGIAALAAQMPLPDVATQALWGFSLMGYGLALVNLNPLLELDGYYILMDLLEAPNLRARALACLGAALRGQAKAAVEPRMHKVSLAFGTACVIYGIAASASLLLAYHAMIGRIAAAWMPQTCALVIGWGLGAAMSLLILYRLLDGLRAAARN